MPDHVLNAATMWNDLRTPWFQYWVLLYSSAALILVHPKVRNRSGWFVWTCYQMSSNFRVSKITGQRNFKISLGGHLCKYTPRVLQSSLSVTANNTRYIGMLLWHCRPNLWELILVCSSAFSCCSDCLIPDYVLCSVFWSIWMHPSSQRPSAMLQFNPQT